MNKSRGGVYNLNYHVVWCTKYRRTVLVDLIASDLKRLFTEKCAELDVSIGAMEVMTDHVHLFIVSNPKLSPHEIIRILKGSTSNFLREKYPQLQKLPNLWGASYFCGTVGSVSESVVKSYILNQK